MKAGGWFKGHNHTEKTKKVISEKTSGKNNPRYGITVRGTEVAKKIGDSNRGKKYYNRCDVKLLYIEGIDKFIHSNDLKKFSKENNYSYATFKSQIAKNWPISRKGKNKGLKIRYATESEISSYINGGTVQDVNEKTFEGFTL